MAGLVGWAPGAGRRAGRPLHRPRPGRRRSHRCAAEQDNLVAALRWALGARRRAGRGRHRHRAVPPVDGAGPAPGGPRVGAAGCCTSTTRAAAAVGDPARRGQRPAAAQRRPAGLDVPGDRRQRRRQRPLAARRARPAGAADAAGRAARRGVVPADRARVGAARRSTRPTWTRSLKAADEMVAHPDPYVQGLGLFARAAVRENGGLPRGVDRRRRAGVPAVRGRRRPLGHGDGGAGPSGSSWSRRGRPVAPSGWRRSVRHMELVGATQDARSIRVLLDVQLALTGDAEARAATGRDGRAGPGRGDRTPRRRCLGLAQPRLAARAVRRGARATPTRCPRPRRLGRPAAAAAGDAPGRGGGPVPAGGRGVAGAGHDADVRAAALLRSPRDEALTSTGPAGDRGVGAWAARSSPRTGATSRPRANCGRSAMRIGGNVEHVLPAGTANGSPPPSGRGAA